MPPCQTHSFQVQSLHNKSLHFNGARYPSIMFQTSDSGSDTLKDDGKKASSRVTGECSSYVQMLLGSSLPGILSSAQRNSFCAERTNDEKTKVDKKEDL